MASPFDANFLSRLDAIIARYPRSRSAIMPMLHLVQARDGYVTPEGIEVIAEKLELTTAEVHAVASFYTQYRKSPAGEYHVGVCTNTYAQSWAAMRYSPDLKITSVLRTTNVLQMAKSPSNISSAMRRAIMHQ